MRKIGERQTDKRETELQREQLETAVVSVTCQPAKHHVTINYFSNNIIFIKVTNLIFQNPFIFLFSSLSFKNVVSLRPQTIFVVASL